MLNCIVNNPQTKLYAGIDLHKKYSYLTIMNYDGYVQHQGRYNHSDDTLLPAMLQYNNLEATVESTYGWYWFADKCKQANIPLQLAHPQKVNAIAGRKKTDQGDSRILADLLRTNLLPPAYMSTPYERSLKELLRFRMQLIDQRGTVKRRLHDILAKQNLVCPYKDILGKKARAWLSSRNCPFPYGDEIISALTVATTLTNQITLFDQQVKNQGQDNHEVKLIQTIPGIGPILGLTLISEIGDIHRFASDRALAAYAGVVPSVHSSGDKTFYGPTSKHGNKYIRWALAEAMVHIVRKDSNIKQFYEQLKTRKGSSKAKVAVMNKMLRCIHAMLTKDKPYVSKPIATDNTTHNN
jgi:transposase